MLSVVKAIVSSPMTLNKKSFGKLFQGALTQKFKMANFLSWHIIESI